MEHKRSTFLSGCSSRTGFFYFAKESDELVQNNTPNSSFFRFRDDDAEAPFRIFGVAVGWPAISMAYARLDAGPIIVAISPYGDYWELESLSNEKRVGKLSKFTGNLRRLASIDGTFYACGMDRVALRRTSAGRWAAFGPGPLKDDPKVVGFEDIAGYSPTELYAVGWGGEIWWYDGKKWRRADSPTSAILSSMTCSPDGKVYVVGHDGVMLKGRRDQWELVETERTDHLKDVAQLGGQIYVCTDFGLFKLEESGLVEETDFAAEEDRPATCLHLLETPGELVSLGTKDVFVKRDAAWYRLV
jgi:hypothetical protein